MSDIVIFMAALVPSLMALAFGIHAHYMDTDEPWHSEPIYHRYQQPKE